MPIDGINLIDDVEQGGQGTSPATSVYGITVEGIRGKLVGLDAWLAAAEQQVVPYDTAASKRTSRP